MDSVSSACRAKKKITSEIIKAKYNWGIYYFPLHHFAPTQDFDVHGLIWLLFRFFLLHSADQP